MKGRECVTYIKGVGTVTQYVNRDESRMSLSVPLTSHSVVRTKPPVEGLSSRQRV